MILNTDGGARGNPGPGAAGIVLRDDSGKVVKELGKFLGFCTNNEAEYKALLFGLEAALAEGIKDLVCNLDSELVVKQLLGEYKVKNSNMKVLFDEVLKLKTAFTKIEFKHVPRDQNSHADKIVNEVLDAVPVVSSSF